LIEAANAAKEVARDKYLAAHEFAEGHYMRMLEQSLRHYRVKFDRSTQRFEFKLQELRQTKAQSQKERSELNLAIRKLRRRFEGKKLSLLQERDSLIQYSQESRNTRLQKAVTERQAAREERLAIWQRYRATGNEQQAIEELRALTATKSTAPSLSWWQKTRQQVASIISRKATNEESSHVQG
jgi:hypothetical protein